MRSVILDLVTARYPEIAGDVLRPLLKLLHASRRTCGGDVDKFLVLLVVAVRVAEHPEFARLTPEQLAEGRMAVLPSLGTNVRSISDSTEIPRETVRRKVTELVESGWLVRSGRKLTMSAAAYQRLAPVREQTELLVARNWETASRLLALD